MSTSMSVSQFWLDYDSIVNNKTKFEMTFCIIDCLLLFSLQPFKLQKRFTKIYFVYKHMVSNDINQQIFVLAQIQNSS